MSGKYYFENDMDDEFVKQGTQPMYRYYVANADNTYTIGLPGFNNAYYLYHKHEKAYDTESIKF